ncbi:MAG TPA: hypothetical protein VME20_06695 [Acidimicrobiales bacterium]|nr:hypothetical protein [Acidimicrobiales bacterium]
MSEWYSIEVFDGATSAAFWAESHGDPLLESALTSGAKDWSWHRHSWGVVLELEFDDAKSWEDWRALAHVQAALDAVPDPISGLIMYRGRGGTSGAPRPRRPKPLQGSGSAALPLPWQWQDEGPAFLPAWPLSLLRTATGAGAGLGARVSSPRRFLARTWP